MLGRRPRRQPCWGDGEVVEPTKRHARTGPRKRVGPPYRIRTQQEGPPSLRPGVSGGGHGFDPTLTPLDQ
jgi:hypothetical protein